MKKSTKLIMTGAASLLGVALAAGGAYATSGLSVSDAPGQLLKISGIAPASAHANQNALDHANENAKGLFGTTDATTDADVSTDATVESDTDTSAEVTEPAEVTPVAPRDAAANASTVKGSETGQSVSAWAHAKNGVEVVAPPAAVSLESDASVGADASTDARTKN